jgi:hypothetical protein
MLWSQKAASRSLSTCHSVKGLTAARVQRSQFRCTLRQPSQLPTLRHDAYTTDRYAGGSYEQSEGDVLLQVILFAVNKAWLLLQAYELPDVEQLFAEELTAVLGSATSSGSPLNPLAFAQWSQVCMTV